MAYDEQVAERVRKYGQMLHDKERIKHALKRLDPLPVTKAILEETCIKETLSEFNSHKKYGGRVKLLLEKWDILTRGSSPSTAGSKRTESHNLDLGWEPKRMKSLPTLGPQDILVEGGIPMKHSHHPSKEQLVPLANAHRSNGYGDYNSEVFTRKQTRVPLAKRKTVSDGKVPSLYSMCIKACMNNIDAVEETGDIPFEILKPVLEKCTERQLARIELKNPYLREDTDQLWERHCHQAFPELDVCEDGESWRECFARLTREQEQKLRELSQRIGNASKAVLDAKRKTKEVGVIIPKEVRKKQLLGGIYLAKEQQVPSAREVSRARREFFETGDNSSLKELPAMVRKLNYSTASQKNNAAPKKAPMMAKALKMLKSQSRFRK